MSKLNAAPTEGIAVTLPADWKSEFVATLPTKRLQPGDAHVVRAQLLAEADVYRLAMAEGLNQAAAQARASVVDAVARARSAKEILAEGVAVAAKFPATGITTLDLSVTGLALIVTQAAEFVFAWSTLPMVIGVRRQSVEGVAIAALAVAALFSLKFAFARLGILGFRPRSSWMQRFATAFAFTVGAITLAMNVQLINEIAVLREVAVAVGLGGDAPMSSTEIGEALRIIALVAAVDGALLVTVFEGERQRRHAMVRLGAAREAELEAHRGVGAAHAHKKAIVAMLENREQWAGELTEAFIAKGDVLIHEALQRGEPKSLEERVARLLGQPA